MKSLIFNINLTKTLLLHLFYKIFYFINPFTALYLLYAKLEENYGLSRHAVAVYDRATMAVLPQEQHEVWNFLQYCSKSVCTDPFSK